MAETGNTQREKAAAYGPILVGVGAALWGTETLWRVFLNRQFPSDVLVFYEHIYCLFFALPVLWIFRAKLHNIPARAWWFLLGSGVIGSAVGTFFFTASLKTVNLTVANVLLNIQPLFSAVYARFLLNERFGKGFFAWGVVAIIAGVFLSLDHLSLQGINLSGDLWMVFITALCWSFATVAGRGANTGMSYLVASPLRFAIGLIAMAAIVAINGHFNAESMHMVAFALPRTHQDFLFLSIAAGVIPLFLYFKGLSLTPASTASFFEMFQIVAALLVTWGFFHQTLAIHQSIAAGVLIIAAYFINIIQGRVNATGALSE